MWDNIVDNFKQMFGTLNPNTRKNSSAYINTELALAKKNGYKPNFHLGNVSVPKGQLSTVFGGYGNNNPPNDEQPNFMNLVLLGLGAFLIIKILD